MAWLHTWTGLVVGWVLFFVFVTGTVGYFYMEIDRWMRPELPLRTPIVAPAIALATAQAHLEQQATDATNWSIDFPGARKGSNLIVSWDGDDGGRRTDHIEALDPVTGTVIGDRPRDTGGGFLLYRMHYQLHYFSYNTAVLIVGCCSMLMLVAIVSGVITHKKIFRNFFTFRPAKGQRSWLDGHNAVSVVALPFFIMITYTGLLFFVLQYMPGVVASVYGRGQIDHFLGELYPETRQRIVRSGVAASLAPLAGMLEVAEKQWGADSVGAISVLFPGDANARVSVYRRDGGRITRWEELTFDGVSGALSGNSRNMSAAQSTQDVLYAVHEGVFADTALRWLYFLSGLLGAVMIGSGLVLWTVKRRPQHAKAGSVPFGHTLVERLNVGTIAGLPIAIAAYFWANRLLPVGLAERSEWEAHVLFMVWGLALLHPVLRPLRRAWLEQLWLGAAAFALLPLLNVFTSQRHLGVTLPAGDWALAGCDLVMLALGLLLGFIARKVRRWRSTEVLERGAELESREVA